MPWKEVTAVNERMQFVARLKAGERMSDLCQEFGISRKTGYKFEKRYEQHGPNAIRKDAPVVGGCPEKNPDNRSTFER